MINFQTGIPGTNNTTGYNYADEINKKLLDSNPVWEQCSIDQIDLCKVVPSLNFICICCLGV